MAKEIPSPKYEKKKRKAAIKSYNRKKKSRG